MKTKKAICIMLSAALLALVFSCFTACSEKKTDTLSKYRIDARLDADAMTAEVTCEIDYVNSTDVPLDEVHFHLYPAAYRDGARFTPVSAAETDNAYPDGISYGGIQITAVEGGEYEIAGQDEDILAVTLPKEILPTQRATVKVEYVLTIPHMRHRLGYCGDTVNLGNWFPIECAYDGGFLDTPYYSNGDPFFLPLCDYEVSITAPSDYTVAMPATAVRSEGEDAATTSCTLKKARDFAAVLGKFETVTSTVDGVNVTYYYTADSDAEAHLKAACEALAYFSASFGAYPYKSYSVVQTGFNQGGMEYTGLVYISDSVHDNMITEVIVHETAHQWWYGIVGNDQINSAWLDESLAEYSTTLFYGAHSEYGVKYNDRIADAMGGFTLYCEMSRCSDTSMERSLGDFNSPSEYAYMTYVKGQLLYDSLHEMLGEKTLIKGLRAYADKCAYKTAKADDLIACLEQASSRELKSFVNSFLDGSAKLYSHG